MGGLSSITSLLWFLVVGLLAGFLASRVLRGRRHTVLGYLIIGVIGSLVGGWLFGLLGIVAMGLVGSLVSAFVGAVVLILLMRALQRV
jgi:uncharacterized membrane protein YeaQ/YmgE (transglycosylase-associated protein family)